MGAFVVLLCVNISRSANILSMVRYYKKSEIFTNFCVIGGGLDTERVISM